MDASASAPANRQPQAAPLPELPVRLAHARAAVDALDRLARASGVEGRIRGFAQPPRAVQVHLTLLGVLALAWLLGPLSAWASVGLALAAGVSAWMRRWGLAGVVPAPPGGLAWNLVLAPRRPETRVLLAGAMDLGAAPRGEVELIAGVAVLVALGALGVLTPWLAAAAWGLTIVWVSVATWRRPMVDLPRMMRTAIDVAALQRPELAVVVSTGGAETAAGAYAFLDWWGMPPGTRVLWMGDAWGAAALSRRGFQVRVVPPLLPAVLGAVESG